MNKLFLSIFILLSFNAAAQEDDEEDPPKQGWSHEGKAQILFNQSAFNKEWSGGGTSSVAGNLSVDYNLNYRKGSISWDNRLLSNYGLTKLKGDQYLRKTSDRVEIHSIAGRQVQSSEWFYSFFVNFRTQFGKGYKYSKNKETGIEERTETTHFLSPAYLQMGPGMLWKKSEDLWVNFAPATSRFIFVDKDFTTIPGYENGKYYGVDAGKSSRYELGASITAYGRFDLFTNVSMENTLSLYSNYLDRPKNVDIDYLLNLEMQVNKFLTTNLIFQAIYDHNSVAAFQIREVLGVGVTLKL